MKTTLTRSVKKAAGFILEAELVAFPTETVYGLGANLFSEQALKKIFLAKGRPADNPLIAHIFDLLQLDALVDRVPRAAERFIEAFFPGPLTLVLPKTQKVPTLATAGLDTLGVRMPRHPIASAFLKACGIPLAAPSANLSGRPSPTSWQAVREDMEGHISCILKGGQTEVGLESTVVDCTYRVPLILRAGATTLEQLRAVVSTTRLAGTSRSEPPKSPGLKYRHYSPRAMVVLVNQLEEAVATKDAAYIGMNAPPKANVFGKQHICSSVKEYARSLFSFFRNCDGAGIRVIYCQTVPPTSLGLALMDRLERASHP